MPLVSVYLRITLYMLYGSMRCGNLQAYVCGRREMQCCVWRESSGQTYCVLSLLRRIILGLCYVFIQGEQKKKVLAYLSEVGYDLK